MMNRSISLLLIIILILSCQTLKKNQKLDYPDFERENVSYRFENSYENNSEYNRDSNIIIFYFFNDFNDSVRVYYNSHMALNKFVGNDTILSSSKYSGVSFGIRLSEKSDSILFVQLVQNRKQVSLKLFKGYPYCTLNRFEGNWIVNYRRKKLILK